ncbi:MAG: hypothetical protein V8T86_01045 [Victivallis sp.]
MGFAAAVALYAGETAPYKFCVLDFTTADIIGEKRFLDAANKKMEIPAQESLNTADRLSINRVMQGFIRMIDAFDSARTDQANRDAQIEDNRWNRARALELYNLTVRGEARPVVLGGEYLAAYLGGMNHLFHPVEVSQVTAAMEKVAARPGFPEHFQQQLAAESGAELLIFGTVSDLRSRERSFRGYGIETKTITWELDVILKVADLRPSRSCTAMSTPGRSANSSVRPHPKSTITGFRR